MGDVEIIKKFHEKLTDDSYNPAIAAIGLLLDQLKEDRAETLVELIENLKSVGEALLESDCHAATAVSSGCELFLRFITLATLEMENLDDVKDILIKRGEIFLQKVLTCRQKIVDYSLPFINEGLTILTHSKSVVVEKVLENAAKANKKFSVFVTQSSPDHSGLEMEKSLNALNIPCTAIIDAAAAYAMEKVDLVLLGAEGVVENGGIINKIGSYQLALCAKALNKPVYVVTESFKFTKFFPLNQDEIPNRFKYKPSVIHKRSGDMSKEHPNVDYTPPHLITLLITDLGVLSPTAVTEELMNSYL